MGAEDREVSAPADDMEAVRATAKAMIDGWVSARMYGRFVDSQGRVYSVHRSARDWMTGLEAKLAGGMVLPDGWTWDDAAGNAIVHTAATFKQLTTEITLWTDVLYRTCTRAPS
ncbi:MAG: hypothetical protein ACP59X_09880 [Solidesulfovibrio sp. DCME]|uniref:hypothetical protein n=1 Tax=Solidesulfovibrio sp. DCME TaxID=3447380 RepID=UPI003D09F82D